MTVAAKESPGAPETAKRGRKSALRSGNPWRRLWQVPLFLAGVAVFGFGVRALVRTLRPVPFEQQVKGVQFLISDKQYAKAIDAINTLGDYYKEPRQQGELQVLAGDTHFLAEKQIETAGSIVRLNYERVMDHYRKAALWGYQPTVEINERWGEAALATGDGKMAAEKLEAAIAQAGEGAGELIRKHGRDLVAAYLDAGIRDKALAMVDRMLAALPPGEEPDQQALEERTWGLCKRIEIALAGGSGAADKEALDQAMTAARADLNELKQRDPMGRVLTWLGRAELQRGDREGAERDLTAARADFAVHHVDDGRAALMLAMLKLDRGDYAGAGKLFQEVVMGHAGTTLWPAARWGRAMTRTRQNMPADEMALADYHFAISIVKEGAETPPVGKAAELITRDAVKASLMDGYKRALNAGGSPRLVEALTFLQMERDIGGREASDLTLRLATTKELRANEMLVEAAKLEGAAGAARQIEARNLLADAAGDYRHHGKATTLNDDQSGVSLWKAGELYDRAGDTAHAIDVYVDLTTNRTRDPRVAEGLLALGRLYESSGDFDAAIKVHEQNIAKNWKTPASYSSAIAAARCYMTLGDRAATTDEREKAFGSAEKKLLALVQDNTDLQPAAREFRESLETLGDLYYAWSTKIVQENEAAGKATRTTTAPAATNPAPAYRPTHWSDAILRLDEAIKRYSGDRNWESAPRVRFMLAESYRKSAAEIKKVLDGNNPQMGQRPDLQKARSDRLALAAQEFSRLISMLDSESMDSGGPGRRKLTDLEAEYLRTSYMDRAECRLERGEFEEAITLYDRAAARFSEELIAVQAYVQIVNAYLMANQPAQASAAAERGRWMLKRIPDAAFDKSATGLSRDYFEKLLKLAGT